jgi:hypothetical protein
MADIAAARVPAPAVLSSTFFPSHSDPSQRWHNQRTKQNVYLFWRKRASTLAPPVQHENEGRGQVLDKKIRMDLARNSSSAPTIPSNFIGKQFDQDPSKVLMKNGPASGPHPGLARTPVLIVVLENGQAEPNEPFVPLRGGWQLRRLNRVEHVMDAADKQFVLIAKMRVKGRSAYVGAIQNFSYGDAIVGLLANQGVQSLTQQALCSLNPSIHNAFFRPHHISPGALHRDDEQAARVCPLSHRSASAVLQRATVQAYTGT